MRKVFLLIFSALLNHLCFAQSPFTKWADNVHKMGRNVVLDFPEEGREASDGSGYSCNITQLESLPKEVALVSFYVFDPGRTGNYPYTKVKGEQPGLASYGNPGDMAAGFFSAGIGQVKQEFATHGIKLYLPEELLSTVDQRDKFNNFKVEHDKLQIWTTKISATEYEAAYGYPKNLILTNIEAEPFENYIMKPPYCVERSRVADYKIFESCDDGKLTNSLGHDLANLLNVDAVLVVYITVYCPNDKHIVVQNANMHMFGRNPFTGNPGQNQEELLKGQWYCGTRITIDKPILNVRSRKPRTAHFDPGGMGLVLQAMARKMATYMNQQISQVEK